jgi:hypothetical protein
MRGGISLIIHNDQTHRAQNRTPLKMFLADYSAFYRGRLAGSRLWIKTNEVNTTEQ